ncbi:hypothetical protein NDU88_002928 [Pleurodeles waltl]|uniref:Uncharacterized protein n=1 Tax=Pleurodeles waltl TaxID=8319 RepID=A0AAV7WTU8_PLEWA|nr:hypothetical protein NDU88_002928 [Pleurodeles waltl]
MGNAGRGEKRCGGRSTGRETQTEKDRTEESREGLEDDRQLRRSSEESRTSRRGGGKRKSQPRPREKWLLQVRNRLCGSLPSLLGKAGGERGGRKGRPEQHQ